MSLLEASNFSGLDLDFIGTRNMINKCCVIYSFYVIFVIVSLVA